MKGYVYNPAWYFLDHSDSAKQALDNLLLTQGWSRFSWTKILANQYPIKKYSDWPFISISGKVVEEKNNVPLVGGGLNLYLEAEDSSSQNYQVPVGAGGTFKIDSLVFSGKTKIYYAYTDNKGKSRPALIRLDDDSLQMMMVALPAAMSENVINRNSNMVQGKQEVNTRYGYVKSRLGEIKELEKVTVRTNSNKMPVDEVNEKYTSGVFRAEAKVSIDNINQPANDRTINAFDYVKNRILQLEIQGGRLVNRKNFSLGSGQKLAVGVFIDEAPADIFQLRLLRVEDLALVKFFEAGFVGVGGNFPGGALAIYTKARTFGGDDRPENLHFLEYSGYSIIQEFYKPDYNNADIKQPQSDHRTTLYWNPDVFTSSETKSLKLNFFNNDFSKKFKVVMEGFDETGKLLHLEKIIVN